MIYRIQRLRSGFLLYKEALKLPSPRLEVAYIPRIRQIMMEQVKKLNLARRPTKMEKN